MKRLAPVALSIVFVLACRDASPKRKGEPIRALPDTTIPAGGGGFALRTVVDSGAAYRNQVFVPKGFDRGKKWPVIL